MQVKRPALKFYGGKWRLAPWIISHFPPCTHYIEPCFGAGSVLLRKPQSELETVNDINERLINFFKILRDQPDNLIKLIDLTPWAQDEYKLSKTQADSSIEDARRFFFMSWMSVNGAPLPTGFRVAKKRTSRGSIPPKDTINHALNEIAQRLRYVQIMNMDAVEFLNKFNNDEDSLIYFDPPYPQSTRTGKFYGDYELFEHLHRPSAEILQQSPAAIVVSGYRSEEYDSLYQGWRRIDKTNYVQANKKRVESIWINEKVGDYVK
jgi:DNA adenine methylase